MSNPVVITPHVRKRLESELIIWLGTVRPDGRPHLIPIWFLWEGETLLFFSQPKTQKIRNMQHMPDVTLALDSASHGEDIVILEGRTELLSDPSITSANLPEYLAKYQALITQLGWEPAGMAAEYSQAIRVTPTRIRAWGGTEENPA